MSHHVDRVWFIFRTIFSVSGVRNGTHHRVSNFVITLRPCVDNFVVLFALSDQAVHVLLFKVFYEVTCLINQWPFAIRDKHVVFTKRDTSLERFAETKGHDVVTEDNRLFLTAITIDRIDDLLNFLLT